MLIDDVDDALTNSKTKTLLKEALESEDSKRVSWGSATDKLVDDDGLPIPQIIYHICKILRDREQIDEAYRRASLGTAEQSILHRVQADRRLKCIGTWRRGSMTRKSTLSSASICRSLLNSTFVTTCRHANSSDTEGDWRAMLLERWVEDSRLVPVLRILNDPELADTKQRVQRFHEMTGGCRRTFMYLQAKIRSLRGEAA